MRRHQRRFEEGGLASLARSDVFPRGRSRVPEARRRLVQRLREEGHSQREIARRIGVSEKVHYRYAAINLDLLADVDHLGKLTVAERQQVVDGFIRSTLQAVPGARKNSMNAHTLPAYVLGIFKGAGQAVQLVNAFEEPVRADQGILQRSVDALKAHHEQLKRTWGIECDVEISLPESNLNAEAMDGFDRVMEVGSSDPGAEFLNDLPIGYGQDIGERHGPRWIRALPRESAIGLPDNPPVPPPSSP